MVFMSLESHASEYRNQFFVLGLHLSNNKHKDLSTMAIISVVNIREKHNPVFQQYITASVYEGQPIKRNLS